MSEECIYRIITLNKTDQLLDKEKYEIIRLRGWVTN